MKLKVDTNDGDFKYHNIDIVDKDKHNIESVCKALYKFDIDNKGHNYPTGSKYGYSMEQISKCTKTLLDYELSKNELDIFNKYIGRKTFHTIYKITLDNKTIYKRQ